MISTCMHAFMFTNLYGRLLTTCINSNMTSLSSLFFAKIISMFVYPVHIYYTFSQLNYFLIDSNVGKQRIKLLLERWESQLPKRSHRYSQCIVSLLHARAHARTLRVDMLQNSPKPAAKEQTRPVNFKLHTEERAARRAGFNDLVASKNYSLQVLRRFEEKIQKVSDQKFSNRSKAKLV